MIGVFMVVNSSDFRGYRKKFWIFFELPRKNAWKFEKYSIFFKLLKSTLIYCENP